MRGKSLEEELNEMNGVFKKIVADKIKTDLIITIMAKRIELLENELAKVDTNVANLESKVGIHIAN